MFQTPGTLYSVWAAFSASRKVSQIGMLIATKSTPLNARWMSFFSLSERGSRAKAKRRKPQPFMPRRST